MELAKGGELFKRLDEILKVSENKVKFYILQITLAFDYLQTKNINCIDY